VFLRLCAGDNRELGVQRGRTTVPVARGAAVLEEPIYRDLIMRANAIDPAVDLGHYLWECAGHFNNYSDPTVGIAYYRLCEMVGDTQFDAVFLLPGGAPDGSVDPVATAMINLAIRDPGARILALHDAGPQSYLDLYQFLPSALVLDLQQYNLTAEDRDLVCLKLLQACASEASIHFAPSAFAGSFFARLSTVLREQHNVCYRSGDQTRDLNGFRFIDPTSFEFVSEYIESISQVVAFDQETIDADRLRLPDVEKKWFLQGSVRPVSSITSERIA
jgi:hypothetical protein